MLRFKQRTLGLAVLLLATMILLGIYVSRQQDSFLDYNTFIKYFQDANTRNQAQTQYESWIGYLYANPSTNAHILNDFKSRAFQPTCLFRQGWSETLPRGMSRPTTSAAPSKELASTAYRNTLECLASPNGFCVPFLDDFRKRFFEPGCDFRNPGTLSEYSTNIQATFR